MNNAPATFDELKAAITADFNDLSRQLRKFGRFALDRSDTVALETVTGVAKLAEVKPSTVIRFAKAFGFDGFSDFQRLFRLRLMEGNAGYEERTRSLHTEGRGNVASILDDLASAGIEAVENLRRTTSPDKLEQAVDILKQANDIHLLAQGHSYNVAEYLHYALSRLEIRNFLADGAGGLLRHQIARISIDDAVIAIGFAPYTPVVVDLMQELAGKGVRVISITDSPLSPLVSHSTVSFEIQDGADRHIRSLFAPICLAQTLVVGLRHAETDERVIAYSSVDDIANPWFDRFSKELEKEAAKRGYILRVADAEDKPGKQLADVKELIARKPDMLILGPIDMEGSAEALSVARSAGIPVMVVNRDIRGAHGEDFISRIYSNFEWVGAKQCEVIYNAFGPDRKIRVVELHGTPGSGNTIGLSKGFHAQMQMYPNMELVSSRLGNFNRTTALTAMQNIIRSGVEFDAVFGHFDEEAIGAMQALKAAGRKTGSNPDGGEVVVVGNGGIADALLAIKAGEYHGLVTVSPYYANQVFDAIDAHFRGDSLPDYVRVDDFVIDKNNVNAYMWFGF